MSTTTTTKRILVVGATGFLGEPVARELQRRGWTVRVLSRTMDKLVERFPQGFELVAGDATSPTVLHGALEGCDAVHVSVAHIPDWHLERRVVEALVPVAKAHGVAMIGYVSGASVHASRRDFAMIDAKVRAEAALASSGIDHLIFRPTMFMETLPRMVQKGKAMVIGSQPLPVHFLSVNDFARLVADAFELPPRPERVLTMWGPEAMTIAEALERYLASKGTQGSAKRVPFWVMSLVAWLKKVPELRGLVDMMRYFETHGELGDDTETIETLGAERQDLDAWTRTAA